jgi:uncharacterized protein (TIGR02466 family)
MIIDLFPQPLYHSMITVSDEEYSRIVDAESDSYINQYGNFTSNDNYFIDRLPNLNVQISEHLTKYCQSIIGSSIQLVVTQSWVNYNPKGSSHHTHWHPNSIVSGVIYISKEPSKFVIEKKQQHGLTPKVEFTTKYNMNRTYIDVEQNMIILFPSDLVHGVDINDDEKPRISLAFNTFYKGKLGNLNQLNYLEIL